MEVFLFLVLLDGVGRDSSFSIYGWGWGRPGGRDIYSEDVCMFVRVDSFGLIALTAYCSKKKKKKEENQSA